LLAGLQLERDECCCFWFCSEGGFFNARMTFPKDYPNSPPQCRFTSEMWHPNGELNTCIPLNHATAEGSLLDHGGFSVGTPTWLFGKPALGDVLARAPSAG
jgi:hypothetical protein